MHQALVRQTRVLHALVAHVTFRSDNTIMPEAFQVTRSVEFRDTDAAGIVHFSVFFTYMEEAEHQLWRHLGLSVKQSVGDDVISWPRVSARCDYKSPARFEDEITIAVRVDRIGKRSVTFGFEMTIGDQSIATGALTAACCRIPKVGSPEAIEIPASFRAKLESLAA